MPKYLKEKKLFFSHLCIYFPWYQTANSIWNHIVQFLIFIYFFFFSGNIHRGLRMRLGTMCQTLSRFLHTLSLNLNQSPERQVLFLFYISRNLNSENLSNQIKVSQLIRGGQQFTRLQSSCQVFNYSIRCSAAAAKSLQSCPTLCDLIDSSTPGSPVSGILQARTLEWVAISFSNA